LIIPEISKNKFRIKARKGGTKKIKTANLAKFAVFRTMKLI
jgi:hypothetical protein